MNRISEQKNQEKQNALTSLSRLMKGVHRILQDVPEKESNTTVF
jgi:hypothetical protein